MRPLSACKRLEQSSFVPSITPSTQPPDRLNLASPSGSSLDWKELTARLSDIVVWETSDLVAYQGVIKGLRDTLFWDHYFEVLEIIPAVEDGYAAYYAITPLTGSAQAS